MKNAERIALIYGLSVAGAAFLSYRRGRRGLVEVGTEAAIHGGLVGTGLNVVIFLHEDSSEKKPVQALPNSGQEKCSPMGKLAADGINILSAINPEVLYKAAKLSGITIGPEGEDPNKVLLPSD